MTVSFQGMDEPVIVKKVVIKEDTSDYTVLQLMSDGSVRWDDE